MRDDTKTADNQLGVVLVTDNFRGKSLSNWMQEWIQWLNSSVVGYRGRAGEVLFTRGAVIYEYDSKTGERKQKETFYNRDEDEDENFLGEFITNETPIYVNVSTAFYFVGETYQGYRLNSLDDCSEACRLDVARSTGHYCKLSSEQHRELDLTISYVETAVEIDVPSDSELASKFEMPIPTNNRYRGFVAGYICMIKRLDKGVYKLKMGARGTRQYITDTTWQLRVREDRGLNIFTDVDGYDSRGTDINEKLEPSPLKKIAPPTRISLKTIPEDLKKVLLKAFSK